MELRLPAPCLIVLVGPSGAGKSTWAMGSFRETEIVSSDRLRGMVGVGEDDQQASKPAFSLLEQIVEERVGRKLTTVIDTLGYHQESRQRWVGLAHNAGIPAYAIIFDTPPEEVAERNSQRARSVPKTVLTKQLSRMRAVIPELADDGFDQVHFVQPVALVAAPLVAASSHTTSSPSVLEDSGHSFGLMINRFDWGDRADLSETLTSIARRAESAGFRDVWMMDHLRQIPQVGRAWEDIPEVYTALAFLAGVTEKIRLGALVTAITHRHPALLGKMIATLDVLSGGRANLGLGLGWDSKEHSGYGIDFPDIADRYALLEDTLELLPLLWGKGSPSFEGRTISATELPCYPRPIQERIPITIGGSGEMKTLRIVARHGDGCNLFGPPDVISRKLTALHRHCAEVDRDPGEIEVTHLVNALTASDRHQLHERIDLLRARNVSAEEFAARHKAGTVDDQITHLTAYRAAGVTHSIVVLPDLHLEGSIEAFGEVITGLSDT